MLNSDHTVKIANLPVPNRQGAGSALRPGSLPRMTQTPVKSTIKKLGPTPSTDKMGTLENDELKGKLKVLRLQGSGIKMIPNKNQGDQSHLQGSLMDQSQVSVT